MLDPVDRLETTLIRRTSQGDAKGEHPEEEQPNIEGPKVVGLAIDLVP